MQPNTQEYPAKTSRLAIASFVCALLGFLCFPAIAGLILGVMAMGKIVKSGGELKGKGLAIAGITISCTMLTLIGPPALFLPFLAKAVAQAPRTACVNNMRQIGLATQIYAKDHNGNFPTNFQSMSIELGTPKVLWCPADTKHTADVDWSTFNPNMNLSYEFLKPGLAKSNALNQVIIRCPVHDNVLLGDGYVQRLNSKR
jgi:hypothetical protein